MSLLAVSFGDRFCVSRKDRTGVGGLVRLMGANTGLGFEKVLVGTRWAVSLPHG